MTPTQVSIHAPTRGATAIRSTWTAKDSCFNPRPYERGDIVVERGYISQEFQSTPLREGRPFSESSQSSSKAFQSTPLREGRLERADDDHVQATVSIHAPTRGATDGRWSSWQRPLVSIHAPTRGATTCAHRGNRRDAVSIHAPTRGATPRWLRSHGHLLGFNPRPYERGDGKNKQRLDEYWTFQSTPLREGRHRNHTRYPKGFGVSIHAPTRGATLAVEDGHAVPKFQSTPLREGRHHRHGKGEPNPDVSIHAPTRGATLLQ